MDRLFLTEIIKKTVIQESRTTVQSRPVNRDAMAALMFRFDAKKFGTQ